MSLDLEAYKEVETLIDKSLEKVITPMMEQLIEANKTLKLVEIEMGKIQIKTGLLATLVSIVTSVSAVWGISFIKTT
jgi:hypothetical protein